MLILTEHIARAQLHLSAIIRLSITVSNKVNYIHIATNESTKVIVVTEGGLYEGLGVYKEKRLKVVD